MKSEFEWSKVKTFRLVSYFLSLICVFLIIKFVKVSSENKILREQYEEKLEREISKKEKLIESYKLQIDLSKRTILRLQNKQTQYEHSLDSLSALKQRTKTVYKEKIIKVDNFNGKELENYFRNKLYKNEF